jgi:AcrR family transcriptional regulator
MPKLKPEELESRRLEIIEAASTCFLRNGFHQTTTDEICREASITPGGLYHYFASKEELIAAVIDHSAYSVIKDLRKMIDEADSAETALRQAQVLFQQAMTDDGLDNATRLEIEIWAEALKNDKIAEKHRGAWAMRQGWLEMLVKRGIEDGIYNEDVVEPRAMASLLLAIYTGMRVGRLLWKDDFDTKGALRSFFLMQSGRITMDPPAAEVIKPPKTRKGAAVPAAAPS